MGIFDGVLGYIAVVLTALLLGILLTVFCFRIRKQKSAKEKAEDKS